MYTCDCVYIALVCVWQPCDTCSQFLLLHVYPRAQTQVIRLDGKHSMSHLREFLKRHIQMVLITCLFIINIAYQLYNSVKSKQEITRIGWNDRALQGEEKKEEECYEQISLFCLVYPRLPSKSLYS